MLLTKPNLSKTLFNRLSGVVCQATGLPEVKFAEFRLKYSYKAYEVDIKEKIVEMALNGSGVRDTARVLGISKSTVISTLKKNTIKSSM